MKDLHWDIRWPQRIVVLFCALDFIYAYMRAGQVWIIDPWTRLADNVLFIFLLAVGGFFN